jgi:hypothetical protein
MSARRRPVPRAAVGGVALALCSSLVAGCGGGSSPGKAKSDPKAGGSSSATTPALVPSGPQRQACTIVSQADVEAAVGAKATAGRPADQGLVGSGCSYALASAADQAVLVVTVTSPGSAAAFDAARQQAGAAQTVSAGDRAFVTGGEAVVLKGTTLVTIVVATKQAPAAQTQAATRLAQAAASHL